MLSDFELWSETAGALTVAILIPFYMGVIHLTVLQLLFYGGVAGSFLAGGEHLRYSGFVTPRMKEFFGDLFLWAQMVLGIGTVSYLIAVIAI